VFFRNLSARDTFVKLKRAVTLSAQAKNEIISLIFDVASDIIEEAEDRCLSGDLWETFLALRIAEDDNPLGRAAELRPAPSGSIVTAVTPELWSLQKVVSAARDLVRSWADFAALLCLENYVPSSPRKGGVAGSAHEAVRELAKNFGRALAPDDMMSALLEFYTSQGSGFFSLHRAFTWSKERALVPALDPDPQTFASIIGYEEQKAELMANTELFIGGRAANNVLLYGDSGTGKSSSVKALLNEPEFIARGLRMIEVRKDQLVDLPEILRLIGGRNYRFILFLDDLSFEEFEVEYKYLKALIEGGVERKPENAVIYATSNRRNIIREVWKDRKTESDDVHGGDTMQEKLSLADRFGITIWYGVVDKERYLEMVRFFADEYGLSMPREELDRLAMRWEIGKCGFSGRTARQFAQHLMAEMR
jgi:predicted AAA+ superfamily ATPase